jgi:hypothetical protein
MLITGPWSWLIVTSNKQVTTDLKRTLYSNITPALLNSIDPIISHTFSRGICRTLLLPRPED